MVDLAGFNVRIQELAGGSFNVSPNLQLAKVLYSILIWVKFRGGIASIFSEGSGMIGCKYLIVEIFLELHKLEKLHFAYVESQLRMVGSDGCTRPNFNQPVTATG
ncbi:hypothetical protein DSUL_100219 [Desulfovibrionales bacterium]